MSSFSFSENSAPQDVTTTRASSPGAFADIVPFKSDSSATAEEKELRYQSLLDEASETDMADLERCGCVGLGTDANTNTPVLMFIPKLGFARVDKSDATLRRMLLLFIKTADAVVKQPFSICYAHTTLSILSQMPLVHKYYKMLPRAYKKNLQKLYVLQPTQIIRVFFEMGVRWFVSEKFYRKLNFIDCISNFQRLVPPMMCQLPHGLLKSEDDDSGMKGSGVVTPLIASFDATLSTTRLIHHCCEYIRKNGLERKGIFRVSGDEVALILVKTRVQQVSYKNDVDSTVIIGESGADTGAAAAGASGKLSAISEKSPSGKSSGTVSPTSLSTVVITCVDTTAQVLKMLLRSLPEPLIPFECYHPLMAAARKFQENKSEEQCRETFSDILACMPIQHSSTLKHLLKFLSEVEANSEVNSMDAENIARIFAPTIMWDRTTSGPTPVAAASVSTEAMQQDLLRAATELNMNKIVVKQLLKLYAADSVGQSTRGGDASVATEEQSVGPVLNAKMLSRLADWSLRARGKGGGCGERDNEEQAKESTS